MGLWDDIARIDLKTDDAAFEDFGYNPDLYGTSSGGGSKGIAPGPTKAKEDSSSEEGSEDKKSTDSLARSRSEGLRGGSDGSDTLGRSRDQGLQGGSSGTLGDGDGETSAKNAAQDAQAKVTPSSESYNNAIKGSVAGDQVASSGANQSEGLDTDDISRFNTGLENHANSIAV